MSRHADEIRRGERFSFGSNWQAFLAHLSDERVHVAEESLRSMLEVPDLADKTFLDIGSGSGLFSLAARRLGAHVRSFDYDPVSVACTDSVRDRFFPRDSAWTVEPGSILDDAYVRSLGQFDVVYSWGVLHHTGDMWQALGNAAIPVREGGLLFIAIYNDEGPRTKAWRSIKKTYNRLARPFKGLFAALILSLWEIRALAVSLITLRPMEYLRSWTRYAGNARGMNKWHDLIDWIGGYPFEAATPHAIFRFYKERGFRLQNLVTGRGLGCNEYVFVREQAIRKIEDKT
ncbi:MAG: class I SAM-dependent methyltransferase [Acidiferrobacteraceae bacterium]